MLPGSVLGKPGRNIGMALLRFFGRALFSSYFVADGVGMITNPQDGAERIEGTVEKVVPVAQRLLPEGASDALPEDPKTWSRIFGGMQIAGGALYTLGLGRRLGALLLALSALPKAFNARNEEGSSLVPLSLLGAAIVATKDTHGKPSLSWKANQARKEAGKAVDRNTDKMSRKAKKAAKKAEKKLNKARKSFK